MNERRERENYDYFDEHRPEPKMELVDDTQEWETVAVARP